MLFLCAVRDSAMNAFMPPFVVPALGLAVRGFRDEVNKAGSAMAAHPGDYELFHVGSFNDETGKVESLPAPKSLVRGADCKEASDV